MAARRRKPRNSGTKATLLRTVSRPFRRPAGHRVAPEAVDVQPGAVLPCVRYIRYSATSFTEGQVTELTQLAQHVPGGDIVWIDVDGLGSAAVIRELGEQFRLHPLALEDVVHVHQRSKVEDYGDHLFIVARMASEGEHLNTEQISIFLGAHYVITFQEGRPGDSLESVRHRLRKGYGTIRSLGADHLAYAILDAVIDGYFPVVEKYGDRLNAIDDELIDIGRRTPLGEIHQMRSELLLLRRSVWPHREAINQLIRETHPLVTQETRIYLRDCYDHVLQIIDVVETYREVCSDIRDFYMSMASHRANEIMKVLTIISTIFIPLSFIAGVYGMNFQLMPELEWRLGYPYSLVLMGVTAAGLIAFIWRKGWLSS